MKLMELQLDKETYTKANYYPTEKKNVTEKVRIESSKRKELVSYKRVSIKLSRMSKTCTQKTIRHC